MFAISTRLAQASARRFFFSSLFIGGQNHSGKSSSQEKQDLGRRRLVASTVRASRRRQHVYRAGRVLPCADLSIVGALPVGSADDSRPRGGRYARVRRERAWACLLEVC